MQIQKLTKTFWNDKTHKVEEGTLYKITFKSLMVMEEDLAYAIKKMFMYAHYKKLILKSQAQRANKKSKLIIITVSTRIKK